VGARSLCLPPALRTRGDNLFETWQAAEKLFSAAKAALDLAAVAARLEAVHPQDVSKLGRFSAAC